MSRVLSKIELDGLRGGHVGHVHRHRGQRRCAHRTGPRARVTSDRRLAGASDVSDLMLHLTRSTDEVAGKMSQGRGWRALGGRGLSAGAAVHVCGSRGGDDESRVFQYTGGALG